MRRHLLTALCLSLLFSAPVARAAPLASKAAVSDTAVTALKFTRRVRNERKRGVKLEDIKMPEASETLDFMIESLHKARTEHAPPKRDYKSPYHRDDNATVEDLEARIDNPQHPTFKKEQAFLDTMLARGLSIKARGIPYKEFVDFATHDFGRAVTLRLDPRENHGANSRIQREAADDPNALPSHWWPSWRESLAEGDTVWFPTHRSLKIADFNRLAHQDVRFVGLVAEPAWGDGSYWSPNEFIGHDILHGHALTQSGRLASQRYHKAVAQVKDAQVRYLLELNFFGNTHEAGDFSYGILDAATAKYSKAKFAAADQWLSAYRGKEFKPHLDAIRVTYNEVLAEAKRTSPEAVPLLEMVWDRAGGAGLSVETYRRFAAKLPNAYSYYDVERSLNTDGWTERVKCQYAKGCQDAVFAAVKKLNEKRLDLGELPPIEHPFIAY